MTYQPISTPLSHALDALGDPWSYLVLQEAFFGVRRFNEFQQHLGIARNTLTDRLNRLVERKMLQVDQYQERPPRSEYRLTEYGLASYSYALSLMSWGDKWLTTGEAPPVSLVHKPCGSKLQVEIACLSCEREVTLKDTAFNAALVRHPPESSGVQLRQSSRPELYTAGRLTSVGRTLALLVDKWGIYVLWLAFSGVTKFDHFHKILGVSKTVLSKRLDRFLENGILEKHVYQARPPRSEYRLTERGQDLCGPVIALYNWGQRLSPAGTMPNILHKSCGDPLRVLLRCKGCGEPLHPQDVQVI